MDSDCWLMIVEALKLKRNYENYRSLPEISFSRVEQGESARLAMQKLQVSWMLPNLIVFLTLCLLLRTRSNYADLKSGSLKRLSSFSQPFWRWEMSECDTQWISMALPTSLWNQKSVISSSCYGLPCHTHLIYGLLQMYKRFVSCCNVTWRFSPIVSWRKQKGNKSTTHLNREMRLRGN